MHQQSRLIQKTFDWETANFEQCQCVANGDWSYRAKPNVDLIADVLSDRFGTRRSKEIAVTVAAEFSLEQLPDRVRELQQRLPTVDQADYRRLLAAIELGRRVAEAKRKATALGIAITSSSIAIDFCMKHFERLATDATQEEFHIITLNTKNRFLNAHQITVGTLDASLVHPREVFRPAIQDAAASIIAVHNHPSGDPTPSREDFAVTDRLEAAGKTLGINVLDHIVVARAGGLSIRESER